MRSVGGDIVQAKEAGMNTTPVYCNKLNTRRATTRGRRILRRIGAGWWLGIAFSRWLSSVSFIEIATEIDKQHLPPDR
jgi:hypothetical protein